MMNIEIEKQNKENMENRFKAYAEKLGKKLDTERKGMSSHDVFSPITKNQNIIITDPKKSI